MMTLGNRASGQSRSLGTVGAAGLLLFALVFGCVAFIALLVLQPKWIDGLQGVVLLIAGFIAVTLFLLMGAVVLTALGMRSKREALGMPPGSIRALIAMVLILIFAIVGLIVFNAGTDGKTYPSTGLTQEQVDALRKDGAIVLQQSLASAAPGASGAPLYDVLIRTTLSRESHDFGLQLLTTVSTLVVAVAGFYFGSKTTESAGKFAQANRAAFSRPEVIGAKPENSVASGPDGMETSSDGDVGGGGLAEDGDGAAVDDAAFDDGGDAAPEPAGGGEVVAEADPAAVVLGDDDAAGDDDDDDHDAVVDAKEV